MKKILRLAGGGLLFLAFGAGCATTPPATVEPGPEPEAQGIEDSSDSYMQWTYQGELPAERIQNKQVRIQTDKGEIVFELLPDVAPITVSNFVYLAEGGYYDGLTFHRVESSAGFSLIQGGDPLGNGTGGPGYDVPAEFNATSHLRGAVAMARAMDPDSAGSQFYITRVDIPQLDNNYTVFGRVLSGMEVVDEIAVGDVMTKVTVENKQ